MVNSDQFSSAGSFLEKSKLFAGSTFNVTLEGMDAGLTQGVEINYENDDILIDINHLTPPGGLLELFGFREKESGTINHKQDIGDLSVIMSSWDFGTLQFHASDCIAKLKKFKFADKISIVTVTYKCKSLNYHHQEPQSILGSE